jgi:GNAT superfamily N-acetyltransferase
MMDAPVSYVTDPFPPVSILEALWRASWGKDPEADLQIVLAHSLGHVGAHVGERLVGFVNLAGDGGVHAFLLDTMVHPDFQRRGIGTHLVREAIALARRRGARWLHVDCEPHLEPFYRRCGFGPTAAGLIRLDA